MKSRTEQAEKPIRDPLKLASSVKLKKDEEQFFSRMDTGEVFPFSVTPYYLSLVDPDNPDDPLRKQCIPSSAEQVKKPYESADPLFEKEYEVLPRLVHRYLNRVLLRVTGECALYCRHCFRRFITGEERKKIREDDLCRAAGYIGLHPEIDEILVSGGDPLTLSDSTLVHIFSVLKEAAPQAVFRLCTRIPVVQPARITVKLVKKLVRFSPVWVVTQFNHPNEVTEQAQQAVACFVSAGIPVLNQTVLLRGVNDSVDALSQLFRSLVRISVKPLYLFQGDLASGTSHFRVSLSRSISLYSELSATLSGIALPKFAVDLPGGGGKVMLDPSCLDNVQDGFYLIRSREGKTCRYPVE